jgi:hypothetical protein
MKIFKKRKMRKNKGIFIEYCPICFSRTRYIPIGDCMYCDHCNKWETELREICEKMGYIK